MSGLAAWHVLILDEQQVVVSDDRGFRRDVQVLVWWRRFRYPLCHDAIRGYSKNSCSVRGPGRRPVVRSAAPSGVQSVERTWPAANDEVAATKPRMLCTARPRS